MYAKQPSSTKRFSLSARVRSFRHALRGIGIIFRTQHNAWIHLFATLTALLLGWWLHISEAEWGLLVLAIASVLAAEAFNTAVEIDINLTSPDFHPFARDTKDVASGAVLLTAVGALLVGVIIFVPKILVLIG